MIEEDIQKLLSGQARMEQRVEDMHGRLFGNGQPGVLHQLHTQSESLEAKIQDITLKIATSDARHEGVAATKAKFWGAISGGISLVFGVFADWLLFGRK